MKVLIFALIILSQNNIEVNCIKLVNNVMSKISNIASSVSGYLKNATNKVVNYILHRNISNEKYTEEDHHSYFVDRPVNYDEMKHLFIDYVKEKSLDTYAKEHEHIGAGLLLATPELAIWHGREMESHIVQTKDGYFLTVHRLKPSPFPQTNRTVLLHHGLLGSSTDWILLGPIKSLPYILANAGYDVWITNARGNYYSRGHLSRGITSEAYWRFSWEEMGRYDLPAVIDYIRLAKDLKESINFIGHSMGASALLVLLSEEPEYNKYVRMAIFLGPLAYMSNVRGPMRRLSSMSAELIKLLGDGEFLPSRKVPSWLAAKYCKGPKTFCSNPLLFISGFKYDARWNASFIARLMYHVPAGGSTNTILHYLQLAHDNRFHSFNDLQAEFSLINVTVPVAIISSSDDWLASIPDVLKLYFSLPNPINHHIVRNRNICHTDLVWGTDADVLVFNKVMDYLEHGLTWNSDMANDIQ